MIQNPRQAPVEFGAHPVPNSDQRFCFIHGILQRSGTNYLHQLLCKHPDCFGGAPIWEDSFLHHSDLLVAYVERLYQAWDPAWEVSTKIDPPEELEHLLGDAIRRFLLQQMRNAELHGEPPPADGTRLEKSKLVISKTPSVRGGAGFFEFFPNDHLIFVVRDGRALTESGVRSFGWSYERAMRSWAEGAKNILEFKAKFEAGGKKFLIVKYRDLYGDEQSELCRIFDFLGLDSGRYDFRDARSIGVIGSSETKSETGKVHWQTVEKKAGFDPLHRFKDWSPAQHKRFNWIAGRYMIDLGYELEQQDSNPGVGNAGNRARDLWWNLRSRVRSKVKRVIARR